MNNWLQGVLWGQVVVLVLLAVTVTGEASSRPKTRLPDDQLFQDQAAFCEGCYGFVHEVNKLLTRWKNEKGSLEDHIDTSLVATCSTDRLRSYVLSPPKMNRLCMGIRAHYEDEVGMALLKHFAAETAAGVDQLFHTVCVKAIPACPKGMKPMSVSRKENMEKAEREQKEQEKSKEAEKTKKEAKKDSNKTSRKEAKKDEL